MTDKTVDEWLVLLRFAPEEVVVSPEEGVELHAQVYEAGPTYHRMARQPNHTLATIPHCLPEMPEGVEIHVLGTPVREAVAIQLGAARCPNCVWEKQ